MKHDKLFDICKSSSECISDLKEYSFYIGLYDDVFDDIIISLQKSHNLLCLLNRSVISVLLRGRNNAK